MNGILLIRKFIKQFRPFVTDAIIPVVNYTEAAMSSVVTV